MKIYILILISLFNHYVSAQEIQHSEYKELDWNSYKFRQIGDYEVKLLYYDKNCKPKYSCETKDTILPKGNYIIKDDDLFAKFTIGENGKLTNELISQEIRKNKKRIFKYALNDNIIQNIEIQDSIGNREMLIEYKFEIDSIKTIMTNSIGEKEVESCSKSFDCITKHYSPNGELLGEEKLSKVTSAK